jgi:hypothetical protein
MILKCLKQIIHPDTLDHFHPELPNIEWTICRKTIYLLLKNGQNAGFLSIFFFNIPEVRGSSQAVDALLEPKHPWAEAGDRLVDWKPSKTDSWKMGPCGRSIDPSCLQMVMMKQDV